MFYTPVVDRVCSVTTPGASDLQRDLVSATPDVGNRAPFVAIPETRTHQIVSMKEADAPGA